MHKTNIKNLDLNLLVALNALLEEKNVTKAAQRIHLSQPATSRALARLREIFQDPLLVKGARSMVLTARAQSLYQPLQQILQDIHAMVSPPALEPAAMRGEITIATRDYELATILPTVIQQITQAAPHLKLKVLPLVGDNLNALEYQNVDFILTATESKAATLHRMMLYREGFIGLAAKDNPLITKKMSLATYVKARHCLVSISGFGRGVVDDVLAEQGLERNIVLRVPHFLAVAPIIAGSDLIVTLPKRLSIVLAEQGKLVAFKPPLKIPSFPLYLYWHTKNHYHPIHGWIRKNGAADLSK